MRRNVRRLNREVGNVISSSTPPEDQGKYDDDANSGDFSALKAEKEPGTSSKKVPKSRKAANLAGIILFALAVCSVWTGI